MPDLTDEEYIAARDALNQAINAYYQIVEPDTYVETWLLIAHKRAPQWERESTSAVGVLPSADSNWVARLGLLEVALDRERETIRQANQ